MGLLQPPPPGPRPQLSWTSEVAPCVQLERPGLSQQGTKRGAPHTQTPSWGNGTADNGGWTVPPLGRDAHHREHPLSLCPLIHIKAAPPWSSCPKSHLAAQGSHCCTARAVRRILPKPPICPCMLQPLRPRGVHSSHTTALRALAARVSIPLSLTNTSQEPLMAANGSTWCTCPDCLARASSCQHQQGTPPSTHLIPRGSWRPRHCRAGRSPVGSTAAEWIASPRQEQARPQDHTFRAAPATAQAAKCRPPPSPVPQQAQAAS